MVGSRRIWKEAEELRVPTPSRPLVHFMVPYSRNENFIAQDQKPGRIREKLAEQNPSYHRRLAIYGLGGVGYCNPIG